MFGPITLMPNLTVNFESKRQVVLIWRWSLKSHKMSANVSIFWCECVQMFICICQVIISFRLWGSDVVLEAFHTCMNAQIPDSSDKIGTEEHLQHPLTQIHQGAPVDQTWGPVGSGGHEQLVFDHVCAVCLSKNALRCGWDYHSLSLHSPICLPFMW